MASAAKSAAAYKPTAHPPATPSAPRSHNVELFALLAMAAAIAAAGLLVDPRAEAAFEAPKRLAALVATVAAALALLTLGDSTAPLRWPSGPAERRAALYLLLGAGAGALAAALAAPRRALSLDAIRVMILFGLLLPLGASRCLRHGRSRVLLAVFLAVCALNAAESILQALGVFELFAIESLAGRVSSVGFIGNEGYLALLMALAAVAALGVALEAASAPIRVAAMSALVLFVVALALTLDLTGWLALVAGTMPLIRERLMSGRRRAWAVAAALALIAAMVATPGLRARAAGLFHKAGAGDWNAMLSYRPIPWAAAVEMIRERPLLGYGPGAFAAEFVSHRLRAEIFWSRRLVNPQLNSFYAQAHCEYLQALAEAGIPAGLAADAAFAMLLARTPSPRRPPAGATAGRGANHRGYFAHWLGRRAGMVAAPGAGAGGSAAARRRARLAPARRPRRRSRKISGESRKTWKISNESKTAESD